MKRSQFFAFLLVVLMMGYSAAPRADDTDIFVDNSTNVGVPNVLFVMFNGADADSDAGVSCTYTDGSVPSTGGDKVVSLVQCALVNAIAGLANGSVNIGIAVNNANSFDGQSQATTNTTLGGFHDLCNSSGAGGCIIRKLMTMDTAGKASMTAFIKGLKKFNGGGTDSTGINLKVNSSSADPAVAMQEAWAYYNGKVGGSGTSYSQSVLAAGCQRNFVVYIGTSAKGLPGGGDAGITAAQVGATTAQKVEITGTVKFVPSICGSASQTLVAGNDWADEWARLMYQQDGGASGNQNTQNITTYSVNVEAAPNKCFAESPTMFSSMAKVGGGKFYNTSNANDLSSALTAILNEVQAVNSVFSSASLPVSVNAQGTYLNQIFLGMFRPDINASPRWMGNLKQYKLVKNNTGDNVLGDQNGTPAISGAGTGFISPNATSYWTYKDTATAPDNAATGGFWVNDPKGVPASTAAFDAPDGDIVEKGGVAQQIRKENLTADYTTAAGSSTNPRRLYTYCPSGSSCVPSLTDSRNAFTTANTGIGSAAFGAASYIKINSITRSGTSATVTTNVNHGFTNPTTVTISGATPNDYNVTQTLNGTTITGSKTFTITGFTDYPTTPSAGTYSVAPQPGVTVAISTITRGTSTTGAKNTETATITTSVAHGFTTASSLVVTGANASPLPTYNFSGNPLTASGSTLTYNIPIYPPAPAVTPGNYTVQLSPTTYTAITNVNLTNNTTAQLDVTTSAAHGLHVGESFIISGNSNYNGTYTVSSITSATVFKVTGLSNSFKNNPAGTGTLTPNSATKTLTALTRTATTVSATASATVSAAAGWFGANIGDTKVVNVSGTAGSNESGYLASTVTLTCLNTGCTQFSYPITVTPATSAGGTLAVGLSGGSPDSLIAGKITRVSGTDTATITGLTSGKFANNQFVTITATGTALDSEASYVGTWKLTCTAPCTTATYGPVTLVPALSAAGSNMQVYSGSTPPDKNTLVNWVRGEDNYGDEKGPGGTITVRPSVHGDVLHSRPVVINYGDARGVVAFYGANDGLYRAVNGSQTASIGTVPPGGELWGLVLPEHYSEFNRLRLNSPELKFPSTILPSAQLKDYFVDGATTAYQQLDAAGTTVAKAYLYLTMRRGGRFMYALDVTTPTAPAVLWKISSATTGFEEMGQTWSRPKVTVLQSKPTIRSLVFGAGYDASQDSEPPGTDAQGRGIYIVNADTGALIWSANSTCTTSSTCRNVPGMTYSIPGEITVVDRDGDLLTDKLYFGDMGGNIWRADVADGNSSNWTVTKIAALGCDTGACAAGTTPRKFFFPPAHIGIKVGGTAGSYDVLAIGSGDREHPLKSTATGSSYNVADKFFMIKDLGTSISAPSTSNVTMATLFNATSATYDNSLNGFYRSLATGEKTVNAAVVVSGDVFLATNRPIDRVSTCAPNLGEAKAYAYSPFTGETSSNVLPGGGLPPTAVAGLVTITTNGVDSVEKFCIGCGVTAACNSALQNCNPDKVVLKNMRRTYWYKK